MMKTLWKTLLLTVCALFCGLTVQADALDDYTRLLDRLENSFWRAVFAKNNSPVLNNYHDTLNRIDLAARSIQELRRKHGSIGNYGDPARPGILIKGLLELRRPLDSKSSSIRDQKTTISEFRKYLYKINGKRSRTVSDEELSEKQYARFLNKVKMDNIEMLDERLRIGVGVTRDQKAFLLDIGQQFYTIIGEARLTILKMRKYDPAFKKGGKNNNQEKFRKSPVKK